MIALSAYGCSSSDDDLADDDDGTSSSSSGGKTSSSGGKTSSSSSGGKSSSSSSGGKSSSSSGGQSSSSSGGESSSSSSGGSSSSSGDAGASSSSSGDGGASSSGGNNGACTQVTPAEWAALNANRFASEFSPQLAGDTVNQLSVSFFEGGNAVGNYNLGTGANADYSTCTQCFEAISAVDPEADVLTYFFQSQGMLNVTAIGSGTITATFTDVKLVESTQDEETLETTPVDGGKCIQVVNGSITVAAP